MGGFSNPLVGGGGALVYPSIHSPNFDQATQTGWAILKDGSAYFFSITVNGDIIISGGNGWFIYNGIAAEGNSPVAYGVAPGVTEDPFGNALPLSGAVVSLSGSAWTALQGGVLYSEAVAGTYSAGFVAASSEGAGIMGVNSGLASNTDGATDLLVNSEANGGSVQIIHPSGFTQNMVGASGAALSSATVTGTTGALATFTIPANDATSAGIYEFYAFGNGQWGSTQEVLTLGMSVNGSIVGNAQGPAAAAFAVSALFRWNCTGRIVFRSAGSSGELLATLEGIITMTANNIIPGTAADNSVPIACGNSATTAIDTTSAITVELVASTSGTETITAVASYMKRVY